jgi:hypothetical protein
MPPAEVGGILPDAMSLVGGLRSVIRQRLRLLGKPGILSLEFTASWLN